MILPSARDCQDIIASAATSSAYYILCFGNIATALGTGATSCTLTTSGKSGADVKAIMGDLLALGYILSQETTTITIKWDNSVVAVHNQ